MSNKKIYLPVIALAVAFTFALGSEAQAQHGHGWGHGHSSFHSGHVYQPVTPSHWGHGHQTHYPNFGWQQPTYHDTTHLDYHAPTIRRHGNHFHVQPGHYDVHRSCHWHH
ncbi:hypothetical protein FHS27_000781 [Rhodopirellula rubra]|uniref:Secreted protein n=1 Tax=Aporhodopirellula rubra TaxID=980271 RepID=A0A7W5H457_9BACT|nr:hypothetical protein [Aporhodopirellula rubra]MBB3205014.1 hypothetical protein [Aporhodopirellula rubra]